MLKTSRERLADLDGLSLKYQGEKLFHKIFLHYKIKQTEQNLEVFMDLEVQRRKRPLFQENLWSKYEIQNEGELYLKEKIVAEQKVKSLKGWDVGLLPILFYFQPALKEKEIFHYKKEHEVTLKVEGRAIVSQIKNCPVKLIYNEDGFMRSLQVNVPVLGRLEVNRI